MLQIQSFTYNSTCQMTRNEIQWDEENPGAFAANILNVDNIMAFKQSK